MTDQPDETYAAVQAARSPEYNRRICCHEAGGHALAARAVGSVVEFVTAVPHGEFAGRCVRRGAPSTSLNLLDENKAKAATTDEPELQTTDLVEFCTHIGSPEVGSPRVDVSEEIVRAQTLIIELLAGSVAERVMFPDLPALAAEHDRTEARALASIVCASPSSIDALLNYCEAEAENLIRANLDIAEALTKALVAKGTMSGDEVDEIISACVADRAVAAEEERRKRWQKVIASANSFAELQRDA